MTVSVPEQLVFAYSGDGSTQIFAYPVRFMDDAELTVVLEDADGVQTVQTLSAHYTASDAGEPNGGSVTMLAAPAGGEKLYIFRATAAKQVVGLADGQRAPAQSTEDQLDRFAMALQDHAATLARSVKKRVGSGLAGEVELPEPAADKIVGWNAGGSALENKTLGDLGVMEIITDTGLAGGSNSNVPSALAAKTYADTKVAKAATDVSSFGFVLDEDGMASDSATKVPTQQSVKAYVDANASGSVADRTALKALDTSAHTVAYLKEAGREGTFQWNASDLSAKITADTAEGIYVAPSSDTTGASGAWVRTLGSIVAPVTYPAIRTIESKLWDRADLRDWNGLDLTDNNDNAALVQAAATAMGGTGNKLYVPAGKIVLGSTVNIPDACHIEGPAKEGGYFNSKSAFFHFGHTGVGFKINTNLGSRSLKNLNTYRTQPTPGAGAFTPTAHDYDIDIEGGQDIELENVTFLNPAKAINIRGNQTTSAPCGRISMRGLRGQPLQEGIRMTHCTDVVYMDEIHFWPFWSANAQVMAYTRANLGALIMGRVDNPKIGRFFCFGSYRGLNIYNQTALGSLPTGTVGRLHASVFEADNCNVGLLISGTGVTADFGAFHCASDPASPAISTESLVWLLGNNADINMGVLRGQYTNGALVAINGTGNLVTIGRSQSANIDANADGPAEFSVDTGNKLRLLSQPTTSAPTVYSTTGEIQVNGQLSATGTWDPASTVNGASSATLIGVTGAAVGDMAVASLSTITSGNWHLSAAVTAANQVTVSLENVTGGTVDLAAGTLKVSVFKR